MGLTPKQEKFAAGIASGLSQAEAYRRAFPRSLNWKDETVWKRASELAANREVSGRAEELRKKAADANEVTVERIVAELAKIAFGDARRVMSWGPDGVKIRESDDLADDEAAIVSEITETTSATGGSLKVKTHDKLGALRLLADIRGAVVRKAEITGKDGKDLVPESKGVLIVPGAMDEAAWEAMMAKRRGADAG